MGKNSENTVLSYWEKQTYFNNLDLVIIGSGIVGLNAALSYKKRFPGSKVMIVERGFLPNGASTKNAGFCCFGSLSELIDDTQRMDEKTVWETVALRYAGLKRLRKNIGDSKLDYKQWGGYEVFDTRKDFEQCADKISSFNSRMKDVIGLRNVYSVDRDKIKESGLTGFSYCIRNRYEGQVNTGLMMQNLLDKAQRAGIIILNNIQVEKIQSAKKEAVLLCADSPAIKAKKIIVATNGFARILLPQLDVRPARAQVLVTSAVKNLKLKGSFHYKQGYYYFRNIDGRVLFGGGRNLDFKTEETTDFGLTDKVQNSLENILKNNILPGKSYAIEHRWSGIMGIGAEKKPIIQKVAPNVVCAVRMGGMGVAIGSLVGEMAVSELIS